MATEKIYCGKCSAENEVGSSFCKKCGAELHGVSAKKPSKMWYLLPIILGAVFLGWLGGIIGYIVLRVRDKKMAKNVLYVGIGTLVLGIILVILVAMVPSPPPADTGVPMSTPAPVVVTPTVTPTPVTPTPSPTSQLTETEQKCRDGLIKMRDSFIKVKNEHGRVLDETSTLEYCDTIWKLFAMSNGKCKQEALEALQALRDISMYPSWVDMQIFNVEHSEF